MGIAIIIPFYKAELSLAASIESALNQTYQDIHIILVSNNATEGSIVIAKDYANAFPDKIKLIYETQQGANFARNAGISATSQEWLQFLDADDTLRRDKIAHQIKLVAAKPDTGLIIGGSMRHYIHQITGADKGVEVPFEADFYTGIINSHMGRTPGLLIKRDWILKVNAWNTSWRSCQEYELMLRLVTAGCPFIIDQVPGADFYTYGSSISRPDCIKDRLPLIMDKIAFNQLIKETLILKGLFSEYYERKLQHSTADLIFQNRLKYNTLFPDFFQDLYYKYPYQLSFSKKWFIYMHYIYGEYVRKSGLKKYLQYAWYFVTNSWKIFKY